jgi:hypothetical protein
MALPYSTSANLPWGTRVLTINAVSYIANSFNPRDPSTVVRRRTELGAPNGAFMTAEAGAGTANLQLATSSTALPARGDEFTTTWRGTSVTFFITEVGAPEEQQGFKTVDISFEEKV